jgi:hypothetical protein
MIADPMADLSGDAPVGDDKDIHSKEVLDPMVLQFNLHRIDRIRSVLGIASGTLAGIAGLTGLQGLGACGVCRAVSFIVSFAGLRMQGNLCLSLTNRSILLSTLQYAFCASIC